MIKNTDGQVIACQMYLQDGSGPFTGAATVQILKDNGTLVAAGGSAPVHKGNGLHTYEPTQAETNADHVAFQFTGSGAAPASPQTYPGAATPQVNVIQIGGNSVSSADDLKADISTLATQAKLLKYIQLLARNDAGIETDNATELGEINNNEGSGAGDYSAQTDAVEALRDRLETLLTTQMTESYAGNGVSPTLAQAIFAIHQVLMHFAISGTTNEVKQLDGTTTAFNVTLNDAANPTGASRS